MKELHNNVFITKKVISFEFSPSLFSSPLMADAVVTTDFPDFADEALDILGVVGTGLLDCFRLAPRITPLLRLAYLRYI